MFSTVARAEVASVNDSGVLASQNTQSSSDFQLLLNESKGAPARSKRSTKLPSTEDINNAFEYFKEAKLFGEYTHEAETDREKLNAIAGATIRWLDRADWTTSYTGQLRELKERIKKAFPEAKSDGIARTIDFSISPPYTNLPSKYDNLNISASNRAMPFYPPYYASK